MNLPASGGEHQKVIALVQRRVDNAPVVGYKVDDGRVFSTSVGNDSATRSGDLSERFRVGTTLRTAAELPISGKMCFFPNRIIGGTLCQDAPMSGCTATGVKREPTVDSFLSPKIFSMF